MLTNKQVANLMLGATVAFPRLGLSGRIATGPG
jgi:hypothetical protein